MWGDCRREEKNNQHEGEKLDEPDIKAEVFITLFFSSAILFSAEMLDEDVRDGFLTSLHSKVSLINLAF
jgi:hypothetical protein